MKSLVVSSLNLGDEASDSLLLGSGRALSGSEPLAALAVLEDEEGLGSDHLADWLGVTGSLLEDGVGSDSSVDLGVKFLDVLYLGSGEVFSPLDELLLEDVGVSLLEQVVVGLDVVAEDVGLVFIGLVLGLLAFGFGFDLLAALVGDNFSLDDVETGETLFVVGDVETTIASTLHGAENTVTSGGANETNIEMGLEGTSVFLNVGFITDGENFTVDVLVAFV